MKMKCPKCNSSVGIHYAELPVQTSSDAHGVHCFLCGYWKHIPAAPHVMERVDMTVRKSRAITG